MRDERKRLIEPYTLEEAAEFLSSISAPISAHGLAHHIYKTKRLVPDRSIGERGIGFSKLALVTFAKARQRRGRASTNYGKHLLKEQK